MLCQVWKHHTFTTTITITTPCVTIIMKHPVGTKGNHMRGAIITIMMKLEGLRKKEAFRPHRMCWRRLGSERKSGLARAGLQLQERRPSREGVVEQRFKKVPLFSQSDNKRYWKCRK